MFSILSRVDLFAVQTKQHITRDNLLIIDVNPHFRLSERLMRDTNNMQLPSLTMLLSAAVGCARALLPSIRADFSYPPEPVIVVEHAELKQHSVAGQVPLNLAPR